MIFRRGQKLLFVSRLFLPHLVGDEAARRSGVAPEGGDVQGGLADGVARARIQPALGKEALDLGGLVLLRVREQHVLLRALL